MKDLLTAEVNALEQLRDYMSEGSVLALAERDSDFADYIVTMYRSLGERSSQLRSQAIQ